MKTIALISLLATLATGPLPAQSPEPEENISNQKPGNVREQIREKVREKMQQRREERLSPDERKRFEAARQKALDDPEIARLRENAESANRAFFDAMRRKMQEIDPGLAEVLGKAGGPREGVGSKRRPPGLESLDEGERQRLQAAREIAAQTPSVQAAEQKRAAAQTPEERRTASEAYFDAMRTAILQADPSLEPTLDKIRPPHHRKGKSKD
jgi:hypothetical protein